MLNKRLQLKLSGPELQALKRMAKKKRITMSAQLRELIRLAENGAEK